MEFLIANDEEKNRKSSQRGKKKGVTYRGTKIRITADLLLETMPEDSGITYLKD